MDLLGKMKFVVVAAEVVSLLYLPCCHPSPYGPKIEIKRICKRENLG